MSFPRTPGPIFVVTGHQAEQIEHALGGRPVRYVHAHDYADGLSASLKAGIAAVPPECAAAVVCLGDMPLVTGRMIDRLLSMYDPDEGRLIVLPTSAASRATRCSGTGGFSRKSCRSLAIPARAS